MTRPQVWVGGLRYIVGHFVSVASPGDQATRFAIRYHGLCCLVGEAWRETGHPDPEEGQFWVLSPGERIPVTGAIPLIPVTRLAVDEVRDFLGHNSPTCLEWLQFQRDVVSPWLAGRQLALAS
jgi:hypothetical protein